MLAALAVGMAGLPGGGPLAGPAPALGHPEPGDVDGDEVGDAVDNCPTVPNGRQNDTNGDGEGDACDADDDGDGRPDGSDACPTVAQDPCPPPRDSDGDGVVDPDDNAPFKPPNGFCDDDRIGSYNPDQLDSDGDDFGDVCDRDDDNDGRLDTADNCRTTFNPPPPGRAVQDDFDGDGIGSACDPAERLSGTGSGSGPGSGSGAPGDTGAGPAPSPGSATPDAGGRARRGAPQVTIRLSRRYAVASGPRRLVVPVRCSEACTLQVRLELGRTEARRLGLGSRTAVLARGRWSLGGDGQAFVFCRWSARATRALRRLPRRGLRARVVVRAQDPGGDARTARRSVTLRP